MKVLIVDDTPTNLLVLEGMLRKTGSHVFKGTNGQEGIDLFDQVQPDLVIMDIMMPVMDGYEATRRIKARCGERFVPVIFLTAISDENELAKCIQAGGDDFLTKPFSTVLLTAKINALSRIRRIYEITRSQAEHLREYKERTIMDQEIVAGVLQKVVRPGCLEALHFKHLLKPADTLSGDLLLVNWSPNGVLNILLGDFTGHGLGAAIGAFPLAEVFFRMTSVGLDLRIMVSEINRTLKQVLPRHLFCCACVATLDPLEHSLTIWNGGMPDILMYTPQAGLVKRFVSKHPPLGIMESDVFSPAVEIEKFCGDDRVLVYSDGVTEGINLNGERFGSTRLEASLNSCTSSDILFKVVCDRITDFVRDAPQADDMTILEVVPNPTMKPQEPFSLASSSPPVSDVNWTTTMELGPSFLRGHDPLPELIRMIDMVPTVIPQKTNLVLILSELFVNALDHGLLAMDSAVKHSSEGFMNYYALREQRLAELIEGRITISLEHRTVGKRGQVLFRIQDSGSGFDYRTNQHHSSGHDTYSGRGIHLLKSLCQELTYSGNGNTVEGIYVW